MSEEKQDLKPEWKLKDFSPEMLPDGGIGLHRFEDRSEQTVHGWKNEQPWHRMAAYMIVAGRTNSEVAIAAGVTPGTVSQIRAQKWFHELLATIANKEGEEVTGAIQSYVLEAVEEVHDLAMHGDSEGVRLKALQLLIEQGRGKPVQRTVSIVGHSRLSPEDEMAELMSELETLRRNSPAPALPATLDVSTTTESK